MKKKINKLLHIMKLCFTFATSNMIKYKHLEYSFENTERLYTAVSLPIPQLTIPVICCYIPFTHLLKTI